MPQLAGSNGEFRIVDRKGATAELARFYTRL
jgi:hypothetical protein